MTVSELIDRAYATAKDKGWHDEERSVGDYIALMHSELSEALEAYRDVSTCAPFIHDGLGIRFLFAAGTVLEESRYGYKPEGVVVELADVVIRIADFCGAHGLDLQEAIAAKLLYNEGRSHRHGGKAL